MLTTRRVSVEVPWRTIGKLIAGVALVWIWLQVWPLVLLAMVAILLAVTLEPVVAWLVARGRSRGMASTLVCGGLFALLVFFLYVAGASLADQAHTVSQRFRDIEQSILHRISPEVARSLGSSADSVRSAAGRYAVALTRSAVEAVVLVVLAFILTLYVLIEGRATYDWFLAFVAPRRRHKVDETATEVRRVIRRYVAGNIVTSVFATVFVLIALSILKVPAALLMALVAGVCDFIPVMGFILSGVPAFALALTVSARTGVLVVALYCAYHLIENYYIAPRVYGSELRLSNVAVVLAFAIGASVAGVVGAAIALPIAAAYPVVERLWLRRPLGQETVEEHRRLQLRIEN